MIRKIKCFFLGHKYKEYTIKSIYSSKLDRWKQCTRCDKTVKL